MPAARDRKPPGGECHATNLLPVQAESAGPCVLCTGLRPFDRNVARAQARRVIPAQAEKPTRSVQYSLLRLWRPWTLKSPTGPDPLPTSWIAASATPATSVDCGPAQSGTGLSTRVLRPRSAVATSAPPGRRVGSSLLVPHVFACIISFPGVVESASADLALRTYTLPDSEETFPAGLPVLMLEIMHQHI